MRVDNSGWDYSVALDAYNGWAIPRVISYEGHIETPDLTVYRATQAAKRDAALSGNTFICRSGIGYKNFTLLNV